MTLQEVYDELVRRQHAHLTDTSCPQCAAPTQRSCSAQASLRDAQHALENFFRYERQHSGWSRD